MIDKVILDIAGSDAEAILCNAIAGYGLAAAD